ncbi:hypothetical protein NC653_003115 [Populus alba x Populus x berolinensis]|uniref:Phytosulfokine n=1 Tax=Populus alba x Populus x berolinensis TaxID=444605 RepID=A0AAD6RQT2_9ROSI|nr:hypothetical protein NC653_003115 [Populus alba x Populus x berolinensis]
MAYRLSTVCIIAVLLLSFTLTYAAPPSQPCLYSFCLPLLKDNAEPETVKVEDGRDGVGEEECLMRRTLAAQTDYIYTQKQKP